MNLSQLQIVDYSKVDSKTLLTEGKKTHEALNYAWAVLLLRLSLMVEEVIARGVSEKTKHMEEEARKTLREYWMLRREEAAIELEILKRIWRNKTNGNFAKFKIGVLRGDPQVQNEALKDLYKILGSIPWKKEEWFHPEGDDGMDGLTDELLAKELRRHEHLDLPNTLEHAINNKFAYLYKADKWDLMDEFDKYSRRPFETYVELDEVYGKNPENVIIDNLDRERRVIRLREAANEETNVVDQGIILHCAELLEDGLLAYVSRPALVKNLSHEHDVSPQYVRRRLSPEGPALAKIRQVLRLTEAEPRVILTDGDEKK